MAAREIIEGPKKVFFRPDFAFFGRTTGLYPLKSFCMDKKTALSSPSRYSSRDKSFIRLVARGIIAGSKRPFFAHTVPFFGHIARLYSLKKPSCGQKRTLFSLLADPSQQA